jgi:AraC-like DNA-binding protein
MRLINEAALDDAGVDALAERLGIGARHLSRLFKKHVGASPSQVAQTARVQRAKRMIDNTDLAMTEIALAAGFGSLRRFNTVFAAVYKRPRRRSSWQVARYNSVCASLWPEVRRFCVAKGEAARAALSAALATPPWLRRRERTNFLSVGYRR